MPQGCGADKQNFGGNIFQRLLYSGVCRITQSVFPYFFALIILFRASFSGDSPSPWLKSFSTLCAVSLSFRVAGLARASLTETCTFIRIPLTSQPLFRNRTTSSGASWRNFAAIVALVAAMQSVPSCRLNTWAYCAKWGGATPIKWHCKADKS